MLRLFKQLAMWGGLSLCLAAGPAAALPPGCVAGSLACAYVSDINVGFVGPVDRTMIDPGRNSYPVLIRVRYPAIMAGRRPVVIWNHGGEPRATGRNTSVEFSEMLASAGYIVIHPSRTPLVNPVPFRAECANNGVVGATQTDFDASCGQWVAHALYGPQNVDFILTNLATLESLIPALAGKVDTTRVLVAGHSAGTTVALANAGAWRQFRSGGPIFRQLSGRVDAFMALAPFGGDYAGFNYSPLWNYGGFQSSSFDGIGLRPFLFVTGKGDLDGQRNPSEARTAGFMRAATGQKYLAWSTSRLASHSTMNSSDCDVPGSVKDQHCTWIRSLGLAFADAYVRRRQEAIDWIASDAFKLMTNNVMEFHRR